MQDTVFCPICGDKLRSIKNVKIIHFVGLSFFCIERTCTGTNHCFQIIVDEKTAQVLLLKFSLMPNYSRFIIIDFFNQNCRLLLLKNSKEKSILIPKIIIPDFPNLTKLKEKISKIIVFY
jgi:phenolic acid decarboxylase